MMQALRFEWLLMRLQPSFWVFWMIFIALLFLAVGLGAQLTLHLIPTSMPADWILSENSVGKWASWIFGYTEMAVIFLIIKRIVDENREGLLASFVMEGLSRTQVFLGRLVYVVVIAVLLQCVFVLSLFLFNVLVGFSILAGFSWLEFLMGVLRVFAYCSLVLCVVQLIPSISAVFLLVFWDFLLEPVLGLYLKRIFEIEMDFLPLQVFTSFQANWLAEAQPLEGSHAQGVRLAIALLYLLLFWGAIYWKLKFRDLKA